MLYTACGLLALIVMEPKFRHKQIELDREFLARERSGMSVGSRRVEPKLTAQSEPSISLRPIHGVMFAVMVLSVGLFLRQWATAHPSSRPKPPSHNPCGP